MSVFVRRLAGNELAYCPLLKPPTRPESLAEGDSVRIAVDFLDQVDHAPVGDAKAL